MQLRAGAASEYQRRHERIWPELVTLLKEAGVADYSIWLDPETHLLFAIMNVVDEKSLAILPSHPVMRRWWEHMAGLMDVWPDNSPRVTYLRRVFHLQ